LDEAIWARTALSCLDLTRLDDGDAQSDIVELCRRAQSPCGAVAAVCVWPRFASFARTRLPAHIAVAAVANFPRGEADVPAAVREVRQIVDAGAQEVDVVLPWRALRAGEEASARALLDAVRDASGTLTLKVILETGELREPALIDRAARLALGCGADFLKTSSGRTPVGATLAAVEHLLAAIAGHGRAGLKISGGIRRVADALPYLELCAQRLGVAALQPRRLRIGASSMLDDIEAVLGRQAASAGAGDA
jgi:deoxyribose-phosphate aldolase